MATIARNGPIFQTDLDAFSTPFAFYRTGKIPHVLSHAGDMHYFTPDGRAIIDATAGTCCANAGHCRAPIANAIKTQATQLELAPYHFAHSQAFDLANR